MTSFRVIDNSRTYECHGLGVSLFILIESSQVSVTMEPYVKVELY